MRYKNVYKTNVYLFKAAHCCGWDTDDSSTFIKSITHMRTKKEVKLEKVFKHPDYIYRELKNDICWIKEKLKIFSLSIFWDRYYRSLYL